MLFKLTAIAALLTAALSAQTPKTPAPAPEPPPTEKTVPPLQPDMEDPMVVRAQQDVVRVKQLIGQGALPMVRMRKAEEALEDAKDMSILRLSLYTKDLLPEQADQMVVIAQKMVYRRQKSLFEMRQLVDSGIISRAEGEATEADMGRAQNELQLAQSRALMLQQIAESVRLEKAIASLETQAEFHPEWRGKVYTRFDGSGRFSTADFQRVSGAFLARFSRPLPVSADGETATHRSLGFDHRGRIDVALSPDQTEGQWLLRYLEKSRIPYFAFRAAVAHQATGAHIHMGPPSTRLIAGGDRRGAGL